MKKKITRLFLLVIAITCMGMFNSCKDYDEDNYNDLRLQLQDKSASLEKLINAQVANLQAQQDSLAKVVASIKSCACSGTTGCQCNVDAKIAAALADYAAQHPDMTAAQVTKIIEDYLKAHPQEGGLTEDQVKTLITNFTKEFVTKTELTDAIGDIQSAVNYAKTAIANDSIAIDSLVKVCNTLNVAAANAQAKADAAYALAVKDSINIVTLQNTVTTLDSVIVAWGPQLSQAVQDAAKALAQATANEKAITLLNDTLANFATKAEVKAVQDSAQALYNKAIEYTNSAVALATQNLLDTINVKYSALEDAYKAADKALADDLADLRADVATLTTQVNANTAAINSLTNAVKKTITSIVVQGAVNPVFGSFALPVGVRSNMLVAYYGQNDNDLYFPTTSTINYVFDDAEFILSDRDAELLDLNEQKIAKKHSTLLSDAENNAGKVYVTVNPSSVDFTGSNFTMVNSLDKECLIKLGNLKPSTDLLTFGWTKGQISSASANAFYEAPAKISAADVEKVAVSIDPELKSAVKAAVKDYKTQLDFTNIASQLYKQFDGILEANAVKGSWTDSLGSHSVYSEYALAATAVKPLSYSFLSDRSLSSKLNKINTLLDKFRDKLDAAGDLDLNDYIDVSKLKFELKDIDVDFSIKVQFDTLYIHNGKVYTRVVLDENGKQKEQITELDNVDTWMVAIINERANIWSAQLREQFQEQIIGKMGELQSQINNMTADLNGQLQENVQEIIDDVNSKISSNIGSITSSMKKYLNKAESAYNRICNYIEDPNFLLQVTMFYEANDGAYHQLSNSKAIPTVVTGTGAIKFYPSSYTAELVAPAYKKFVAVTNVIKGSKNAQDGDADCVSVLKQTNSNSATFNTVLDGGRYAVAFQPAASGYTYEIYYCAADYSGKISARRFYVTVK